MKRVALLTAMLLLGVAAFVGCAALERAGPVETTLSGPDIPTSVKAPDGTAPASVTVKHDGVVPGPVVDAANAAKPFIPEPFRAILDLALAGAAIFYREKNKRLAQKAVVGTHPGSLG